MLIFFLFRGLLIGLIFGIPAGAVGAMTVQRTWHYGVRAGLLTGLGSSAADCFYACVGAFGLTLVSDFLMERQNLIRLAGGCLILLMGVSLLLKKENHNSDIADTSDFFRMFLSSFAVGITNPAAILTFLFAFSWFGIAGGSTKRNGWLVVLGVFLGTYLWWGGLTAAVSLTRKKKRKNSFQRVNRMFGAVLSLFGVLVFIKALPI